MKYFEIISTLLFLLIITIKIHGRGFGSSDYFDANFDESNNCQNQNKIKELKKLKKCQVANAGKWERVQRELLSVMLSQVLMHNNGKIAKLNYPKC